MKLLIPHDVPKAMHATFEENYYAMTRNTHNLFLFVADHTLEHLYDDFITTNIKKPEDLFMIASHAPIGAFATYLGLIARYSKQYPLVNYVVKLTGKTNAAGDAYDPLSIQLNTVQEVVDFKKETGIPIRGVAATLYLGSAHEGTMLKQAAQIIFDAHMHGLVAFLWVYARGKAVKDETSIRYTAGCAAVANTLGADFVKLKMPKKHNDTDLVLIAQAAGNTHIIYSGGSVVDPTTYLANLSAIIDSGYAAGTATGRNIFSKPTNQAISFSKEIAQIIYKK